MGVDSSTGMMGPGPSGAGAPGNGGQRGEMLLPRRLAACLGLALLLVLVVTGNDPRLFLSKAYARAAHQPTTAMAFSQQQLGEGAGLKHQLSTRQAHDSSETPLIVVGDKEPVALASLLFPLQGHPMSLPARLQGVVQWVQGGLHKLFSAVINHCKGHLSKFSRLRERLLNRRREKASSPLLNHDPLGKDTLQATQALEEGMKRAAVASTRGGCDGSSCNSNDSSSTSKKSGGGKPGKVPKVINLEDLTEGQTARVKAVYQELLEVPNLVDRAAAVGITIDMELVARYFVASQWRERHHGMSMADMVQHTIKWREEERVWDLTPTPEIREQVKSGCLYVQGTDAKGRTLIYYRPALQDNSVPKLSIRFLVYTLEVAVKEAQKTGGDSYSFIIDCTGIGYRNAPPLSVVKAAFHLLMHHYPSRVGFIAITKTAPAFQMLWKVMNPLVSPTTRHKILFTSARDEKTKLLELVGAEKLESEYGGKAGGGPTRSMEEWDKYLASAAAKK